MISNDTCTYIFMYSKIWKILIFFPAEDSGVSSGAVPSAPPLPTISENEEEEPLLEEDFSVALLEDDQRDFEAGMVVSTSKVGILWKKKSLNSQRFSLTRETDTKMTHAKSWAICKTSIEIDQNTKFTLILSRPKWPKDKPFLLKYFLVMIY